MRTTLVLALLAAACVSATPPAREPGDVSAPAPSPGLDPDLSQAQFFARTQGGTDPLELQAESFAVQVHTGPQAVHTHLSITMKNPGHAQAEAVMRLPIPPGAAVTRAVLWVGNHPMEGAFVARDRAQDVYRAITERRRDPALITWSGPEWIEATVFPVEANGSRLFELEWIEPVATSNDQLWYRIPVLAHEGRQITRPDSLTVDGQPMPRQGRTWLALPCSRITGVAAVAREPGNPFGYAFSPAKVPEKNPIGTSARIVVVADTSRAMAPQDRKHQSRALTELLAALPEDMQLDLLAVDWRVRTLAEAAAPSKVREVLDALDAIPSAGSMDLDNALVAASERARVRHAARIIFVGHGHDVFHGDAIAAPLRRMQEAGQMLMVMADDRVGAPLLDAAALTGGQKVSWAQVGQAARLVSALERQGPSLNLDSAETFFALETVTGQTRWLARFVGQSPAATILGVERDLEALWTRAHVVGTADREADPGERYRVLTPLTSILVLETTADYGRWGIPAPGNPDNSWEEVLKKPLPKTGIRDLLGENLPSRTGRTGASFETFGRDTAVGSDTVNVLGGVVGDEVGSAYGVGGLGLLGIGQGGSGNRQGARGRGQLGTIGYGRSRSAEVDSRVSPPTPQGTVWDSAMTILSGKQDLATRVSKVAESVGAPKVDGERPAVLAWWLSEHHLREARLPFAGYLVIATLLKEAGLLDDAVRILSEAAAVEPDPVAKELGRWGQVEDAKRVAALKARDAK